MKPSSIVPSGTAEFNMWFYPIEGVQMRLGYTAMSFLQHSSICGTRLGSTSGTLTRTTERSSSAWSTGSTPGSASSSNIDERPKSPNVTALLREEAAVMYGKSEKTENRDREQRAEDREKDSE